MARHWHHLCSCAQRLLLLASIDDCYISSRGHCHLGNFDKATFDTISRTYSYLPPNLPHPGSNPWKECDPGRFRLAHITPKIAA
ncbi:hypothetical protein A6R68_13140 [Neotoma lepida]|uniref:Small ribosomal subunit protein uS5 C-terminal domain-containing protein n=1 Tax=Neotoma lepida TaxID=56216 RepID=A0A1A6H3W5_NEOLE|nr:hypothetical protein A6R68_13140 [Neotoma lepida]